MNSRKGWGRVVREPRGGCGDNGGCGRIVRPQRDRRGSYAMDIGHRLGNSGNDGRAMNSRGMGAG